MLIGAIHVPRPGELASGGVKSPDDTRRLADILSIGDPTADHHLASNKRRSRGDVIIALDDFAEAFLEVHGTVDPELSARLAAVRVDCQQPGVGGGG